MIGAGAAGLMAALELKAVGHDVKGARGTRTDRRAGSTRCALQSACGPMPAPSGSTPPMIAHELCERYAVELTPRFGFESLAFDGVLEDRRRGVRADRRGAGQA